MIACLDVQYDGDLSAEVGCLVFQNWEDESAVAQYSVTLDKVQPYVPGEFYKRELPCLLAALQIVKEPITTVVVDGHVWLTDLSHKGVGAYLYQGISVPVIGVAKNRFHNGVALELLRGQSNKPLYITAAGMDVVVAKGCIEKMHGEFRIPTLLKAVDHLARKLD